MKIQKGKHKQVFFSSFPKNIAMQSNKTNLNTGYNPFSQHSVFNVESVGNLQPKSIVQQNQKLKQERQQPYVINRKEIVEWKKNYFAATENINELRGPKYICDECTELFNTRLSFLTHSKMHLKPFCILCGTYKTTLTEMYEHMKLSHTLYVNCKQHDAIGLQDKTAPRAEHKVLKNSQNENKTGRRIGRPRKYAKKQQNNGPAIEPVPKKTILTSRSGRCITMKVLDF